MSKATHTPTTPRRAADASNVIPFSPRAARPAASAPRTEAEIKRTPPLGADMAPAVARLRQIATESGDHLLLGDGVPNPDGTLLGICAEATHARIVAEEAFEAWKNANHRDQSPAGRAALAETRARDHAAAGAYKLLLKHAAKLRAVTGAGIYAKALACRASRTGAPILAMSLADDLLGNPALRVALWAASPEAAPAAASNVVPMLPQDRGVLA